MSGLVGHRGLLMEGSGVLVERNPMQWSFSAYSDTMVEDPQPLRTEVRDFEETFASTANLDVTSTPFGATLHTVSAASNILTAASGRNTAIMAKTSISSFPAPDAFVEIAIASQGSSATQDIIEVGIFLNASNFVTASLDRAANLAFIQVTQGGTTTNRVGQVSYTVPAGAIRLGLGYLANWAAVYVDSGSGWNYITGGNTTSFLNLIPVSSWTGLRAGIILASTNTTTWTFSKLRSGRFGAVGFRDPTLVTNRDGTPYEESGMLYMTASTNLVAGSGGGAGGATRLTKYEIDPTAMTLTIVGTFYVVRSGNYSGDINLHIVDNGDGTQDLFWATWGTGPFSGGALRLAHKAYTGDYHKGSNVETTWTVLSAPQPVGANAGAYDPMAWHDGTDWIITYCQVNNTTSFSSGYFPALASTPDLSTWTTIATDSAGANLYEGTKLAAAAGDMWYFAGGPQGTGDKGRIYNNVLSYQADLAGATFSGGSNTQPHPMVFLHGNYAWLITFDNTQTRGVNFSWGKYIVQRSPRYI